MKYLIIIIGVFINLKGVTIFFKRGFTPTFLELIISFELV